MSADLETSYIDEWEVGILSAVPSLQKVKAAAQQPVKTPPPPRSPPQTAQPRPTSVHHSLKTVALGFVFQR